MPLDTTYRGEDRIIEFQIKDSTGTPIPYNSILRLILVFYYEANSIIGRYCNLPGITNFTEIDRITNNAQGIFEIYLLDEMIKTVDPTRPLKWEIKVTQTDLNSPNQELDSIAKGEVTKIEESVTRNLTIT